MEFKWVIKHVHEKSYRDFVDRYSDHDIVIQRIARNIKHIDVSISKARFWRTFVGCLLTTQQRSGEGSRVSTFLSSDDDMFDLRYCSQMKDLPAIVAKTLSRKGLRRKERIGAEIDHAVNWLNKNGWHVVKEQLDSISSHTNARKERTAARFFQEHFKGLGPKQSRNLIQWLGLSKYEIPLDSRMIKVLRELQFPVPLSAAALSDEGYYCFVEDGIQQLMRQIDIYPCVFDACAFASLEKDV